MKILISYASTEGQTRKIARFCADHLNDLGHSVEILPAADAVDVDFARYDGVVVAGSVHAGNYQKSLVKLARKRADELAHLPTIFLSVSLAAAGMDEDDWAGLEDCVNRFISKTAWSPEKVLHVAGAFRFSEYDFFRSWAMRWIASQKDETVDSHADKEYTDWDALKASMTDWVKSLSS